MLAKYYFGGQIKEDEVCWACRMHRKERSAYRILKEINYLNDLAVEGRIILKWVLKSGVNYVDLSLRV